MTCTANQVRTAEVALLQEQGVFPRSSLDDGRSETGASQPADAIKQTAEKYE